ncbi:MAG: formylglycine-generating enzyme family protein [Tepidiformaceae bacterium]
MTSPSFAPTLVSLPGGDFLMGNDTGRPDERPAHRIRLAPFRAAVSPVTNAEYARFVAATGAAPAPFLDDDRFTAREQPVVGINWHEAVAYCDWLVAETGIPFRLPTEAEREYAARGGFQGRDWPWPGADASGHPAFEDLATLDRPHPPTEACANGFGLRCMAENVHEWCADWYAAAYYATSPADAPAGPVEGRRKLSRGGAWRHSEKFTRVAARSSLDPTFRYSDFGFRVYASLP